MGAMEDGGKICWARERYSGMGKGQSRKGEELGQDWELASLVLGCYRAKIG